MASSITELKQILADTGSAMHEDHASSTDPNLGEHEAIPKCASAAACEVALLHGCFFRRVCHVEQRPCNRIAGIHLGHDPERGIQLSQLTNPVNESTVRGTLVVDSVPEAWNG